MKSFRKPGGEYIEFDALTPHSDQWVEVAFRPDENHTFSDNWYTDPLNPEVCWRVKTQAELDAETAAKKAEIKSMFQNDDIYKAIRLALSATLSQAQAGTLNAYSMNKLLDDVANSW